MALVMGSKRTLDVNYRTFFVAGLSNWRQNTPDSIGWIVIVVITNFATASFRPTDIETMGTIFRCWVGKCAAAPDGVDGCSVIPGTRRFQIAVRIDADEKMIGEEEDGGN